MFWLYNEQDQYLKLNNIIIFTLYYIIVSRNYTLEYYLPDQMSYFYADK